MLSATGNLVWYWIDKDANVGIGPYKSREEAEADGPSQAKQYPEG